MIDVETFWFEPGCAPGMSREETEEYLRGLEASYRARGDSAFADALIADARRRIFAPRPGPDATRLRAWEHERGITLPATLREALQVQDGGYVRGTRLLICPLEEMAHLGRDEWVHAWENEENRAFGDPSKLVQIGYEEGVGGIVILDGNVGPEPRIIWLWRDLGDELRDHGDRSFDLLIQRLREAENRRRLRAVASPIRRD